MNLKRINKTIEKHEKNIAKLIKLQSGVFVNETKKQQLQEKINKENYMIDLYNDLKNGDESAAEKLRQAFIDDSAFTKLGNNLNKTGDALQSTGKGMVKAGAHTTAAVWTPALYVGYRGVKHLRNKPKNESVEQDLIELINEVEKAHKDGKITEEQKREYIINFVDEFYKK